VNVFDQMMQNEAWEGFGYLGGRNIALTSTDPEAPALPAVVAVVDDYLITETTVRGWTEQELFDWANSRLGRWFADATLINAPLNEVHDAIRRSVTRWNLLQLVDPT
jgi:hypothetical protein